MIPFNPLLLQALYTGEEYKSKEQRERESSSSMHYYEAVSKGKSYNNAFSRNKQFMTLISPLDFIKCQVKSLRDIVSLDVIKYETKITGNRTQHCLYLDRKLDGYNIVLSTMIREFDFCDFCSIPTREYTGFFDRVFGNMDYFTQDLIIFDNSDYFKPSEKAIEL